MNHCKTHNTYFEGECDKCSVEEREKENESYTNEGYAEINCPYCNSTQWMLLEKRFGVCSVCLSNFENPEVKGGRGNEK